MPAAMLFALLFILLPFLLSNLQHSISISIACHAFMPEHARAARIEAAEQHAAPANLQMPRRC